MTYRTIPQARFYAGGYGGSLVFNGTSDYATIPIIPSLTSFSWSAWIKMDAASTAFGRIFDYYDSANVKGTRLLFDSTVLGRFNFDAAGGSVISAVSPNRFKEYNSWVHLAGVYGGTTIKLYMMGQLLQTQSKTITAPDVAQVLTLGKESGASASFGKFSLANFAWHNNSAWTDGQVLDSFFLGKFPSGSSWFRFNNTVKDLSGNGNDITLSGPTYSSDGPFSTARQSAPARTTAAEISSGNFNNSAGRIDTGAKSVYYNNAFTLTAFVQPSNAASQRSLLGWSGNTTPQIRVNSLDQLQLLRQNVASVAATTKTLTAGQWYYVAVSYDTNGDYKFYIGNPYRAPDLVTSGNSLVAWSFASSILYIGNIVGFGQAYRGLGRGFKIFNRALTQAEVNKARIENLTNSISGCVGFWPLNEGSGSIAKDFINGNHGTITNIVYSSTVLNTRRTAL